MRVKFLKNKILMFSLSFLSLFGFGSITQCNNALASEVDQASENVDENPDEILDQNNEDKIDDDPNNEEIDEADDQNFGDPHEEIPEKNEQYSQDGEQPPISERYKSESKVNIDGELGKVSGENKDVVESHDGTPERNIRKLSRRKVKDLVKLRGKDKAIRDHKPGYSVVSGNKGLSGADSSKNGELFESLSRASVEFAHHFDILEKVDFPIPLDCVIPLCTSSRPFLFAHMFNLKPLSTPFDLVEKCSLKKVISLFENDFSDFFVDVKKVRSKFFSKTFVIRDLRNNLRSSFSFKKDFSFKLAKEGLDNLRDFYLNRMRESVNRSNSIGLVCDGHYPSRSLVNFVRRFGRIYPDKTIVLINIDVVRGIEGALHISSPFASDKLKVVQFIVPERNVNKWDGIAYCIDAGQERELKK